MCKDGSPSHYYYAVNGLQENIKTLLKYVVERFMESLEGVDYVETFKTMKLRYEQEMDGNNKQTEAARWGKNGTSLALLDSTCDL